MEASVYDFPHFSFFTAVIIPVIKNARENATEKMESEENESKLFICNFVERCVRGERRRSSQWKRGPTLSIWKTIR